MLRSISLSFPLEKEMLAFSHSMASAAESVQTNLGERKTFLTNMISVQQNKLHRIVQQAPLNHAQYKSFRAGGSIFIMRVSIAKADLTP